jgi:hypothetical protein
MIIATLFSAELEIQAPPTVCCELSKSCSASTRPNSGCPRVGG